MHNKNGYSYLINYYLFILLINARPAITKFGKIYKLHNIVKWYYNGGVQRV